VIAIIHNSPLSPAGHLVRVLERAQVVADHVRAHQGEHLPTSPRAVIILGGEMGAFEDARYPYLKRQKAWVRGLIESDVPVLGLCLGAQLIADAMGGSAHAGDRPEADLIDLTFTEAGAAHPVIGPLVPPVVAIHSDTFELPEDAVLLAHSDRYPHAFSLGSALGVQFHPEVQTTTVSSWARFDLRELIVRAGTDPEGLVHRAVAAEEHLTTEADRLFTRWLGSI
jgi:GMP synthase-like glutamine amidotransferase